MLPMELTVVLLQEKAAQPSGQTMEPENIIGMISVPDLLSDPYSPSLCSVVPPTFPHQAWVFYLLISVIPFTTCDYLCKLTHLDCELLVYVLLVQSMA